MVLGVIFVWMMVRVYNSIDTVPTWYSIWTPMGFFLTMFMGGPLLGYLLLSLAGVDGWRDASAASNFCTGTGSEWRDVSDAGRRAGDYS